MESSLSTLKISMANNKITAGGHQLNLLRSVVTSLTEQCCSSFSDIVTHQEFLSKGIVLLENR